MNRFVQSGQVRTKSDFVALTGQLVSVAQRISMVACNLIGFSLHACFFLLFFFAENLCFR